MAGWRCQASKWREPDWNSSGSLSFDRIPEPRRDIGAAEALARKMRDLLDSYRSVIPLYLKGDKMPNEMGDLATWVTSLIAAVALVYAVIESRSANRAHQKNDRLAAENSRLLQDQKQLSERTWTEMHFQAVRVWADRVCCNIAEAMHILADDGSNVRRRELLANISSLIDSGRWYFPNRWSDKVGTEKEPAYRGVRQPVLDTVVAAYDCIKADATLSQRNESLLKIQRQFVSQIQEVLDPIAREREIRKMIAAWQVSEKLRGLDI